MLGTFFTWFYCLDYYEVLFLLMGFTGLFYVAKTKYSHWDFWKPVVAALLFSWVVAMILITIFQRSTTVTAAPVWRPFQSYINALKSDGEIELLRSNFMNTVLFYPAGILLMSFLPNQGRLWLKLLFVLILLGGLSAGVEFVQYRYNLGLPETDDIIHNSLGAVIGAVTLYLVPIFIKYINPQK